MQNSIAARAIREPRSLEEAEALLREMAREVSPDRARFESPAHGDIHAHLQPAAAIPDLQHVWDKATFQSLVESAPDGLVIINQNGSIVLVNAQTEKLFGYGRGELLGQPIEILVPERIRQRHVEYRTRYFTQPSLRPMGSGMELSGRRKDGRDFPVEISISPLKTDGGLMATCTIRDISDRKRLEARYRTLVEGIPAVTFMAALDESNNEFYVSPQIEQMLGFSQAEWLGDPFLWYRQLHPDDRARWGTEFARTCAAGVKFSSEYRFISRDNREVWVHGEARVVCDEHGQPMFLQGIAFDITASKLAEQSLRVE